MRRAALYPGLAIARHIVNELPLVVYEVSISAPEKREAHGKLREGDAGQTRRRNGLDMAAGREAQSLPAQGILIDRDHLGTELDMGMHAALVNKVEQRTGRMIVGAYRHHRMPLEILDRKRLPAAQRIVAADPEVMAVACQPNAAHTSERLRRIDHYGKVGVALQQVLLADAVGILAGLAQLVVTGDGRSQGLGVDIAALP